MTPSRPIFRSYSETLPDEEASRGLSIWSVVSVVSAVILCVPFVTALVAIGAGLMGLRETSPSLPPERRRRGREAALLGITIGSICILVWLMLGVFVAVLIIDTNERLGVARTFLEAHVEGELDAADRLTVGMPADDVATLRQIIDEAQVRGYTVGEIILVPAGFGRTNRFASAIEFKGPGATLRPFLIDLVDTAEGPRVSGMAFTDARIPSDEDELLDRIQGDPTADPATQPATRPAEQGE